MSRIIRVAVALSVVLGIATSLSAAPAQPTPVNLALPYPSKAPVVVHLYGLERSRERLAKIVEALPPNEAKHVKQALESGLDELLKGRKLDAVPKDGRVFFVLHDIVKLVEGEPDISFLIPVTGYKEAKETLLTGDERKSLEKAGNGIESIKTSATGDEHTLYLVELKGYVAVTPSKEVAEMYAGKYASAQSGAMGPDLSSSFLNADVSLFVNMDVINDLHGDKIRQFKGLIDFALGQAANMGMVPGLGKQQIEVAKVMIGGVFQAVEDSKGLVLAAEFRAEGLNLRGQIRFAEETTSAEILKSETPTSLAELTKLPKGLSTYGVSRFGRKFADLGKKFSQEFLAGDDDEKGAEKINKLLSELAAAGPAGEASASHAPEQGITVTAYKNAPQAVEASLNLYRALGAGGKFATIVLKNKPQITEKAASHRDISFHEVKLAFDFEATVESLPDPAKEAALGQFKRLMKEKTTFWIGTDGKVVIQIMAKDWDAAKRLLDDYLDGKAGVGGDAGFQLARKNLPQDASLLYMLETGQVVTMLVDQARSVGQMIPGGNFPQIGKVKPVSGDATYIGFALVLKPQLASVDLFIPGTSMNVAAKMIAPLFRNIE